MNCRKSKGELIGRPQCCNLFRKSKIITAIVYLPLIMKNSPSPDFDVDHACETCPVRNHAICSVLGHQGSHALSDIMHHKHYGRGETLWADMDEAHVIAIVVRGTLKLYKVTADGRQQVVGLLFPSDCVGRPYSEEQLTYAEAVNDVEICCFPRQKFEHVLKQYPELEHELFERTMNDLERARDWMLALGRMKAIERIASFISEVEAKTNLIKCVHNNPPPSRQLIKLPLSRSEIADCLGLTTETVSRNITTLKVTGVIKLVDPHVIEICDPDALAKFANP